MRILTEGGVMQVFRLLGFGVCMVLCSSAFAIPIVLFDSGKAVGITGAEVGTNTYDVSFLEGTCAEVFSGCDEQSDLTFSNAEASSPARSG